MDKMRESRFIHQNREKWRRYEDGIKSGSMPAEEMESAFVELNDDLAYARTFYKNRAVRLFLNNMLAPVYSLIYKGKKWSWKNISTFFVEDAPRMNFAARKYMLISLITVMLGFSIGFFSTRYNPEFANIILGNDYVATTERNIEKGDPLAIYKDKDPGAMFQRIATNNLRVAAFFFFFGALFCVGTMYLLLSNGIMLGAFTWMFTSRGLANEYLLTVYQHGTLEILSMVIEGAAGIMLGAGILFPGTFSRARSIQNAAKKSVVMFLVCVPIIVLAAFIESYLTRFTEINNTLRFLIIFMSFVFMLYYFVIYPIWKFRKSKTEEGNYDKLEPDANMVPIAGEVYSNSNVVLFAFDFIKKNAAKFTFVSLLSVTVVYFLVEWMGGNTIYRDLRFRYMEYANASGFDFESERGQSVFAQLRMFVFNIYAACYFFSPKLGASVIFFSGISISGIVALVLWSNRRFLETCSGIAIPTVKMVVAALLAGTIQVSVNYLFGSGWWFSMLVVFPLQVVFAGLYCMSDTVNPFPVWFRALGLVFSSFGRILGSILITSTLYMIMMFGILYLVAILFAVSHQFHGGDYFTMGTMNFYTRLNYFIIPIIMGLNVYYFLILTTSVFEIQTGTALQKRIAGISFRKEVYGVETE